MDRKQVPVDVETAVLLKGARRCTLCFHLNGDLNEKNGQIAHLDKNPSNCAEENLAFLCLDHHTLFDSRTSQHKNYTLHEVKTARASLYEAIAQKRHLGGAGPSIGSGWEVRYPGGLVDVSALRDGGQHPTRLAIAEDVTLVNRSSRQVSLRVIFLIQYGETQLAADPTNLPAAEWAQLLDAFGIRQKSQLSFPLNLPGHHSVEGHIAFPVRWDGAGRGIAGDVPERRRYSFEFEELLTTEKRTVSASAVYALDKSNHQRSSRTDFALPGPREEAFVSWQHFNYQKTVEAGGRKLYDDLILGNFTSHSVSAPCTMREIVEQIAQHSQKRVPIESLTDCLSGPQLSRALALFGSTGSCLDGVVGNYDNLEWWVSSKGLNISIRNEKGDSFHPTLSLEQLSETMANPRYSDDILRFDRVFDKRSIISHETVFLVVGSTIPAELLDRPVAELLRDEIDRRGKEYAFRRGIVINDQTWYHEIQAIGKNPVIAVGGAEQNKLAKELDAWQPAVSSHEGKYEIKPHCVGFFRRNSSGLPQVGLWGHTAADTRAAAEHYLQTEKGLTDFLRICWRT
jgi:hypothetical protein